MDHFYSLSFIRILFFHSDSNKALICDSDAICSSRQSQAFSANGQVWIAGQVAADIDGNLIKGSMTEQAHQICKNIGEILSAAGSNLEKTVKVTVRLVIFSVSRIDIVQC